MVHNEGRCLFLHSLALHCYGIEYFKAVGGVLQKYVSKMFIVLVTAEKLITQLISEKKVGAGTKISTNRKY